MVVVVVAGVVLVLVEFSLIVTVADVRAIGAGALAAVSVDDRLGGGGAVLGVINLAAQPVHAHSFLRRHLVGAHLQRDGGVVQRLQGHFLIKDVSASTGRRHARLRETWQTSARQTSTQRGLKTISEEQHRASRVTRFKLILLLDKDDFLKWFRLCFVLMLTTLTSDEQYNLQVELSSRPPEDTSDFLYFSVQDILLKLFSRDKAKANKSPIIKSPDFYYDQTVLDKYKQLISLWIWAAQLSAAAVLLFLCGTACFTSLNTWLHSQ